MAGKNDEIKIVENSHLSDDVLRRRYGEFSTAGAKVLTCIKNKESGEQSAIVCENTDWYDILTKKTNYFKGNWRQYTKFMIINYNRCFELSADVFKELSKAYLAPKKDTYEMDRTRGLLYVAKKYLKKFPWSLDDYSISDDQYEHDRSLLRMLLELGLVVRRDCESGKIFIEAKEVDAVNK